MEINILGAPQFRDFEAQIQEFTDLHTSLDKAYIVQILKKQEGVTGGNTGACSLV
jgi:hypothetical protein